MPRAAASASEPAHCRSPTCARGTHNAVAARLADAGADLGEAFWLAVRGNLATLGEARLWADIVHGPIEPVIEDAAFLAEAAGPLPPEPGDEMTWKGWTSGLGRKGRARFHPLRLALTGQEKGPEIAKLLPLIGRSRSTERLLGRKA